MAIPARPTVYNGIRMRSRMEARVAAYLDRCGFPWEYEPEAYGSPDGQYLPDFVMRWDDGAAMHLDVKGAHPTDAEFDALLRRMMVIRASEPQAQFAVISDPMLRAGRIGLSFPGREGWIEGCFIRCPDHPETVTIRVRRTDRTVAPWCPECDPRAVVRMDVLQAVDFIVGEADAARVAA